MDKNSIVILPEGSEIPSELGEETEIIGFLQENGSLKIKTNKHEGPDVFENMSEFFKYVGNLKRNHE